VIILILSIILLFIGFETFNAGGLISPLFVDAGYVFILLHIFVIIGLYKKKNVIKKIFVGENLFFIALIIYYVLTMPKLSFGPSPSSEPEPAVKDYIKVLSYGLIPLIFFIVNIIVSLRSSRESKD
jgi:hypothetical protein